VAGLLGALVATLAIYVPSSIVVYAATRWWHAQRDSPWRGILERGLAPIAVGLVFAAGLSVLQAAHAGPLQIATAAIACLALLYTNVGAYTLMGIAGLVYAAVELLQ
jgi:chromate transporter